MTQDNKVLWRVWGEYHQYPECCINAFVEGKQSRLSGCWIGSGYMPCGDCAKVLEGKGVDELTHHIGRNPFTTFSIHRIISDVTSDKFIALSNKYGYDREHYLDNLKNRGK